jgi:hypothetical protein
LRPFRAFGIACSDIQEKSAIRQLAAANRFVSMAEDYSSVTGATHC